MNVNFFLYTEEQAAQEADAERWEIIRTAPTRSHLIKNYFNDLKEA